MDRLPMIPHPWDAPRAIAARETDGVDRRAIEAAVKMILLAIGEDPDREGLQDTPERVGRAWVELSAGQREDPADHLERTFVAASEDQGIVLQRAISFYSLCEHHLLPFYGTAHVAYIPNQVEPRIVGLSKLVRLVQGYGRRLQVQERMTAQIAEALVARLDPYGVCVVVEAEHLCMGMRGIRVPGSVTTTSEVRGIFKEDDRARQEIMALMQGR